MEGQDAVKGVDQGVELDAVLARAVGNGMVGGDMAAGAGHVELIE